MEQEVEKDTPLSAPLKQEQTPNNHSITVVYSHAFFPSPERDGHSLAKRCLRSL